MRKENHIPRKVILALMSALYSFSVVAQTVVWQMKPSNYSEITRMGHDLYKVVKNGKIGIIHANGSVAAEPENDAIGLFYEHKSLLTLSDGHGERVSGCLTDDGRYYKFATKYYTLNGQKFFSDNVLSVSDENGRLGYVDGMGNAVIGFDGKYDRIKPFTEGYAAVFKNKKYHLINKDGTPAEFIFNGIAEVNGGTNVINGLAYLWDTDGKFYAYDTSNRGACKKVNIPGGKLSFDYLYRIVSISKKTKEVPFVAMDQQGLKGIRPVSDSGIFGYVSGDNVVLPNQLSDAVQFEDGFAVVSLNGKKGILRYVDGESFKSSIPKSHADFYKGNTVSCSFILSVPSVWQTTNVDVKLTDNSTGASVPVRNASDNYTFSVSPSSTCQKSYTLTVRGDDLRLYESPLTYSFREKEIVKKVIEKKANPTPVSKNVKLCPTCHLPFNKCKYQFVH